MQLISYTTLILSLSTTVLSLVKPIYQEQYDFIVVGSGIGGGTLAIELARKNYTTLLIESGPDYDTEKIKIPFLHVYASGEPQIHLDYRVQYYSSGYASDRLFHYPRVGGLGGCSTHNVMISVLPNTRDFNLMAELTGDSSWKEAEMRNYFKKLERNYYSDPRLDNTHGYQGWFPISYTDPTRLNDTDPKSALLFPSIAGNFSVDINGYNANGQLNTDFENKVFVPMAVDQINFERVDFKGRIKQTQKQFPLDVWTDTHVTKVLLDRNNKAYGVEFVKGKHLYKNSPMANANLKFNELKRYQVFTKKEVIVSAGAFNTPQILMLSGIGDRNQLSKFGIEVKAHLPGVGENLMDKHETAVSVQIDQDFTLTEDCTYTLDKNDPCYLKYKKDKSGPYIFNAILSGELKKSSSNLSEPNLFLLNVPANFTGYEPGFVNNIMNPRNFFSQVIFQVHTKAKGYVKLRSNNPLEPPTINFNKFQDGVASGSELDILLQSVKSSYQFMKNLKLNHVPVYPKNLDSDDEIRKFIKSNMFGHHICCTAKLGLDQDKMAVLDSKFKVRNTKSLRVVDASAFNLPPGYFPSLFTHLMAMKVADIIDEQYK